MVARWHFTWTVVARWHLKRLSGRTRAWRWHNSALFSFLIKCLLRLQTVGGNGSLQLCLCRGYYDIECIVQYRRTLRIILAHQQLLLIEYNVRWQRGIWGQFLLFSVKATTEEEKEREWKLMWFMKLNSCPRLKGLQVETILILENFRRQLNLIIRSYSTPLHDQFSGPGLVRPRNCWRWRLALLLIHVLPLGIIDEALHVLPYVHRAGTCIVLPAIVSCRRQQKRWMWADKRYFGPLKRGRLSQHGLPRFCCCSCGCGCCWCWCCCCCCLFFVFAVFGKLDNVLPPQNPNPPPMKHLGSV